MKKSFYFDEEDNEQNIQALEESNKVNEKSQDLFSTNGRQIFINIIAFILFIIIIFATFYFFKDILVKNNYTILDSNTNISRLEVIGGVLDKEFSSDVYEYNIVADNNIQFECEKESSKTTIIGCDDTILIEDNKEKIHKIIAIAEDKSKVTYTFKIKLLVE